MERKHSTRRSKTRWALVFYDVLFTAVCAVFFLLIAERLDLKSFVLQFAVSVVLFEISRFIWDIYLLIWRFGGVQGYLRLICADMCGFAVYFSVQFLLPCKQLSFLTVFAYSAAGLMLALSARMVYRYLYKYSHIKRNQKQTKTNDEMQNIAIIGAGSMGATFANDLLTSKTTNYMPCIFIDVDEGKIGRKISNMPVIDESSVHMALLDEYNIHTVVFCVQHMGSEEKRNLYEKYRNMGRVIKSYDNTAQLLTNGKTVVRDFDIEELLFRNSVNVIDDTVRNYYTGKVVMITGGGGSIGGELCRQIAKMAPKKIIILDIAENGSYEIQQEFKMQYGEKLDISVEILSVCDEEGTERVFSKYRPQIVLHAAAHKHVPLMENNPIEAIINNVFGTLNVVKLADKYEVEHFILVSTDKAVNPTNVMGATKRFCEYIVGAYAAKSKTVFTATRFGNVLDSAGSVVPLFKKQIANGGPVTVTDKRIIRYFMTIPEASQLVLASASMAQNGELFVLDMGEPVKIWEFAENMIKLCGYKPYEEIEIVETGLRPGEKLYEELLMDSETLSKTDNDLIYIEKDDPLSFEELTRRLGILKESVKTGKSEIARAALYETVPTFCEPNVINDAVAKETELSAI